MHLSKVNEALGHKITSGSEYQWHCYGPSARFLDYESEHAHASVIYSTETQEIFQAEVSFTSADKRPYRWLNPITKQVMFDEAAYRNVNPNQAWDDVEWTDLETEEDFLEKATAMFNGLEFDTRIEVPIDLDDDLILKLSMEAHKRDITLNKMVELVLQEAIDHHKESV